MDAIPFQVGSPHSLVRALLRRNAQGLKEAADATPVRQPLPAFTIAFSREAGTRAVDIAHELGVRLNWPVFDRELVGRIADDLGLRAELLEEVDEKQVSWIEETVATFGGGPVVSGAGYAKHLASTVLALGAHGECIIVGRGSAQILPAATTLRVRLIAPLKDRAQVIGQRLGISFEKAQRRAQEIDKERAQFVENAFHKDPRDPRNYDLMLDSARFGVVGSAKVIFEALGQLRSNTPEAVNAGV
jgi:hypothetical protein